MERKNKEKAPTLQRAIGGAEQSVMEGAKGALQ